jgi:hypothetical protein
MLQDFFDMFFLRDNQSMPKNGRTSCVPLTLFKEQT